MVLESGQHLAIVELDRHVADQPRAVRANGLEVDEPDAGQSLAAHRVAVAEQLVSAADGEHDGAARRRGVQGVALGVDHVARAERLVAVLAAADVEQVVGVSRVLASPIPRSSKPMPRQAQRRSSSSRLPRSA